MKAPEKPKIVLQLAHAKDCPANYIKNDIDLCPCGYNDNEQKLARWATYAEQEITRLTSALERARGEAMREVLDELGSLPAIYFGEGSPSIALGNQMFLCAKLRKQFLKEDKHHA